MAATQASGSVCQTRGERWQLSLFRSNCSHWGASSSEMVPVLRTETTQPFCGCTSCGVRPRWSTQCPRFYELGSSGRLRGMLVMNVASRTRPPVFESQLCHLLSLHPWESCLTFPCLSLPASKVLESAW